MKEGGEVKDLVDDVVGNELGSGCWELVAPAPADVGCR